MMRPKVLLMPSLAICHSGHDGGHDGGHACDFGGTLTIVAQSRVIARPGCAYVIEPPGQSFGTGKAAGIEGSTSHQRRHGTASTPTAAASKGCGWCHGNASSSRLRAGTSLRLPVHHGSYTQRRHLTTAADADMAILAAA
ncbi:hypothetical protein GQ53DRAFT_157615 [Thozetella sp. PMI_491]|nr:hypothetical protein GQ53DRAFT_157615 [Thozetella sp. PMI_491]